MYHSTLEDVEGKNFKVIDVVFTLCVRNTSKFDELLADLDKQAESLGANGIIGITYSGTTTWAEGYSDPDIDGICYDIKIPGMIAYGTAIFIED